LKPNPAVATSVGRTDELYAMSSTNEGTRPTQCYLIVGMIRFLAYGHTAKQPAVLYLT